MQLSILKQASLTTFLHQKVSKDKTVASLERATNQKEVKYFMELNNEMVNKNQTS